ncbi:MAG: RsmE family RNA methyltransferase [bacterium]
MISPESVLGNQATLGKAESHHLKEVLRKKVGDVIPFTDGRGRYFEGKIIQAKESVILEIISSLQAQAEELPQLILAQALLKNPRMDWLVEKATELGAHTLLPFHCERGVVKTKTESEKNQKIKRWERIAVSALKQSARLELPQIGPILSFKELMSRYAAVETPKVLFTVDSAENVSLRKLGEAVKESAPFWIFVIGPEGGFTPSEIAQAKEAGFLFGSLGRRALRAETAALATLSIFNFLKQ